METKHLKKYAPEARRDFMEAVVQKAAMYGLLPKETLPLQEEGDVVIIGDRPFPRSVARRRKELEARIAREGFQSFIEAIAYTWFNRLVAIRFMELHGYLSHGYRVLSHPSGGSLPEVMEFAERLDLPGLDRDAVIDLKLDGQKDELLYQMLLTAQCNELHTIMPFMFEKVSDATELLLPDNLLHSESLIRHLVAGLPPDSLEDIEAVGWLYQFYISEKKNDVFAALKKGKKITPQNIPAATQLFTPHWIVRYLVENSLGRLWMLNHPDSPLAAQMDYYIKPEEPETDFLRISSPEEIKICDPACGSGHMLTYAFDLLYAIYEEQGYPSTDIPRLILTHNLYGIEIDQRAGALAAFALTMKAREKDRRFFTRQSPVSDKALAVGSSESESTAQNPRLAPSGSKGPVQPNICVLENIQIDPEDLSAYMDKVGRDLFSDGLQGVVNQWEEADNFGSLIRPLVTDVSEVLELLRARQLGEDLFLQETHQKVLKALRQADYLSPKYHVVVANPPYMGNGGMLPDLKTFLAANFPSGKSDLMTSFMGRALSLVVEEGYWGMINLPSWMYLSTYKDLRLEFLDSQVINSLVHLGRGIFGADFGTVAFSVKNSKPTEASSGIYRKLFDRHVAVRTVSNIKALFLNSDQGRYCRRQSRFKSIPGCPIVYDIGDATFDAYERFSKVREFGETGSGLQTSDNNRFLRQWFEVSRNDIELLAESEDMAKKSSRRWFPHKKGGPYRKWYGNNDYVLNWKNGGQELFDFATGLYGSPTRIIKNTHRYYQQGITWSHTTSSRFSARCLEQGFIFNVESPALYVEDQALFLNYLCSAVGTRFIELANPTLHFVSNSVGDLPFANDEVSKEKRRLREISASCVEISRNDWDTSELSWNFEQAGLTVLETGTLSSTYEQWRGDWRALTSQLHSLETENNSIFVSAFGLEGEVCVEAKPEELTINNNPVHRYDADKSDSELEALLLADTMREFISYAVGCMLGRYSLDKPGLILANQGETADDYRRQIPEPTFAPDEDNVIPLLDGDWFTDDISERFKEFLKVTFGTEHYEENLTFLENALYPDNLTGKKRKTIHDYFLKDFYNHHIRLYKKRPIYWLFSSGKQGAFKALIYMHRYNPSTLSRMRTEYVVPLQGKFNARIEQLDKDITVAGSTSHRKKLESERTTLIRQREEIQTFDEKLRHYADQRIEFDLDDGVKENYGKFGDLLAEVKAITGKKPVVEVLT